MKKLSNILRIVIAVGALFLLGRTFLKNSEQHVNVPAIKEAQKNNVHLSITLRTHEGDLRLGDLKGQPVLVFFGYMFCPDFCPTTLTTTALALKNLPEEKYGPIKVVFVSIDPQRDTPEKLSEYVKFFGPQFVGATSTKDNLDLLTKSFYAGYKIQDKPTGENSNNYMIDHTTYMYLLDKNGVILDLIEHTNDASKLQKILEQKLPEA